MSRYAIVNDADGDILNIIEWDGQMEPWHPDFIEGQTVRPCGDEVDQTWTWDGAQFVPLIPPTPPRYSPYNDLIDQCDDCMNDTTRDQKLQHLAGMVHGFLNIQRDAWYEANPE